MNLFNIYLSIVYRQSINFGLTSSTITNIFIYQVFVVASHRTCVLQRKTFFDSARVSSQNSLNRLEKQQKHHISMLNASLALRPWCRVCSRKCFWYFRFGSRSGNTKISSSQRKVFFFCGTKVHSIAEN